METKSGESMEEVFLLWHVVEMNGVDDRCTLHHPGAKEGQISRGLIQGPLPEIHYSAMRWYLNFCAGGRFLSFRTVSLSIPLHYNKP